MAFDLENVIKFSIDVGWDDKAQIRRNVKV